MPKPRRYRTVADLEAAINGYFEAHSVEFQEGESVEAWRVRSRITMAGLCNHLGIPKQTWHDYAHRRGYEHVVLMAKQRVEQRVEEVLLYEGGKGAIFWLKNHAGYTDKTEQEVNVRGNFHVSDEPTIDEFDQQFAVGAPVGSADGAGEVPVP